MNLYGVRLLRKASVQRTAVAVAAVVLLAYRALTLIADQQTLPWGHDFAAYWVAGFNLATGHALYQPFQLSGAYSPQGDLLYLNPPILAVIVAPFESMFAAAAWTAYLVWSALGLAVFAASVFWLANRPTVRAGLAPVSPLAATIALVALPAVSGELVNGNVDFFLVGLLVLAWAALERPDGSQDSVAGVAIGLAAILKVFPGLLLVWLLLSGRFRAAAWTVGTALVLALVTVPITGIQPWLDYPSVLLNMGGATDPTFALAPTAWLAELVGATPARVLVVGIGLAVVAVVARRSRPAAGPPATGRAFAVTVAVSLLLSPVLWSHYLTLAVMPLLVGIGAGLPVGVAAVIYLLLSVQNQAALGDLGTFLSRLVPMLALFGLVAALVARPRAAQGTT